MYSYELFETGKPRVVVTYPGRFQPFHQGHAGVFAQLQKKFGRDNVYILTSNDQSGPKSPFNFSDKYQLMTSAGVPGDRIIETSGMYVLPQGFDPASTIFVTAVGAPDAQRLNPDSYLKRDNPKTGKKAGDPAYFKTFNEKDTLQPATEHGYVIIIPEIHKSITINGKEYDVSHGTECRNLWNAIRKDQKARVEFLTQLYGKASPELAHIFDKIPQATAEDIEADGATTASPISGRVNSLAEGVLNENEEYVLYLNGKPAGQYRDTGVLKSDLMHLKKKYPDLQYEIKKEICKEVPVTNLAETHKSQVEAYGYAYNNRDQRVMWRKIFPSSEAAYAWADKKNATVLGVRPLENPIAEAAMNPSAFAQSIKQGQDKGVKVGFEFEVLIPADSVAGTAPIAGYNPDDTSWIDGKTVGDLGAGAARTNRSLKRILDDLVKNKRSVATELGTDNIWNAYFTWGNEQIKQEGTPDLASQLVNRIYTALKDRRVSREVLSDRDEEYNGTAKDVFIRKLADAGIDVTGRRKIKPESLTSQQIAAVVDIGRAMYYKTSASDSVFRDIYGFIDQYNEQKRENYFGTYSGTNAAVIENFNRFCQAVYGTSDLKELLKTKWAFRGRTNNTTPTLKEKLWYYVTPGAPVPASLASRSSSPTYKKGADFLKQHLQGSFGANMEIFTDYHQATKKLDRWYIEPDGSLRPKSGDYSAEVVSPPLAANDAMAALKTFYQHAQQMKLYTNDSTGLHINVSIPETLDVLKLALFAGDQHVLKTFGRENNSYARSILKQLKGAEPDNSIDQFPKLEKELQAIAKSISNDHFATVNFNGKYVSFRHAGGDYLSNMNEIVNTVGRFVRAMIIASDPNAYRNEYINKILRLVQPEQNDSTNVAALRQEELKSLLTTGIPVVKYDVALRAGFTDSAALIDSVRRLIFRGNSQHAIATIQADPGAQQRLLASNGFGRPSREYLEQAPANVFYTVTVIPTSIQGFYKIRDVTRDDTGSIGMAQGVYDNRNNRFALAVGHPAALTRKDPNFSIIFGSIKGKANMAGPRGHLPEESLNEFAADGFGNGGDNRSKIVAAVKSLLASGNKVDWLVPGQRGHVVRANDDGITMKRYGMPRSKMHFFLPMSSDVRDSRYQIKLKAPKHYVVVSADELAEDAAGVGVVAANKKMAKDPRYSMSITKDVKPNTPKDMLRAFRLSEDSVSEQDMMKMIKEFLPVAMKDLKLTRIPHIVLQPHIEEEGGQATFGRFVNEEEKIYLGIADRHPVDILRTLAHELVHFKQYENDEMYPGAGETGSPIENEAHWVAGIIMRHFNKKFPDAIKSKPLELGDNKQ